MGIKLDKYLTLLKGLFFLSLAILAFLTVKVNMDSHSLNESSVKCAQLFIEDQNIEADSDLTDESIVPISFTSNRYQKTFNPLESKWVHSSSLCLYCGCTGNIVFLSPQVLSTVGLIKNSEATERIWNRLEITTFNNNSSLKKNPFSTLNALYSPQFLVAISHASLKKVSIFKPLYSVSNFDVSLRDHSGFNALING